MLNTPLMTPQALLEQVIDVFKDWKGDFNVNSGAGACVYETMTSLFSQNLFYE